MGTVHDATFSSSVLLVMMFFISFLFSSHSTHSLCAAVNFFESLYRLRALSLFLSGSASRGRAARADSTVDARARAHSLSPRTLPPFGYWARAMHCLRSSWRRFDRVRASPPSSSDARRGRRGRCYCSRRRIQLRNLFVCVSYSRRHLPSLAAQVHAAPAGGHVSACDAHAQGRVAHARRVGNNACAYARRVASRCAIMARASSRCSCQTPCGRQGRPRAARARTARGTATHVVALDASRARGLFQGRTFLFVCVLRCAPQSHTLRLRCVILCAQDGGNKYSVPWTSVDMTIGEFKQAASIVLGAQCALFLFMFSLRNLSLPPESLFSPNLDSMFPCFFSLASLLGART